MIYVRMENGRLAYQADTAESAACLESLMQTIKRKAEPYFRRGYTSVTQGRPIRTYEEARNIVYAKIKEHSEMDHVWLWDYACIMARSYRAGVEAAQAEHLLVSSAVAMPDQQSTT